MGGGGWGGGGYADPGCEAIALGLPDSHLGGVTGIPRVNQRLPPLGRHEVVQEGLQLLGVF